MRREFAVAHRCLMLPSISGRSSTGTRGNVPPITPYIFLKKSSVTSALSSSSSHSRATVVAGWHVSFSVMGFRGHHTSSRVPAHERQGSPAGAKAGHAGSRYLETTVLLPLSIVSDSWQQFIIIEASIFVCRLAF